MKMTEHHIALGVKEFLAQLQSIKDGTGHSIYGASSSHMYLPCPGSLIPNIQMPDPGNADAAYGTVAHAVTEEWLRSGKRPDHLVGTHQIIESYADWWLIVIDEEMMSYVKESVDRCEWEPGDHLVEEHVDFSHLTPIPNQGGTLDHAAMVPGRATCTDHKYGASPENIVMAEDNSQGMLYCVGLDRRYHEKYNFKEFVIRINQPRLGHFDEWVCSRKRLLEFAEYAKERMALAWHPGAERVPGVKQCRFCKVRATCSANAAFQAQLLDGVFTDTTVQTPEQTVRFMDRLSDPEFDLSFKPVGDLSVEQMARLLPFRSMADAWWAALEDTLNRRALERGMKIPGYKLVEARTHRKFPNKARAERVLISNGVKRSNIITESLCTPAEAERQLRAVGKKPSEVKEILEPVVFKPQGQKVLAPINDVRPEATDVAESVFGDTTF